MIPQIKEFNDRLKKIINIIDLGEIEPNAKKIIEFCELISDDNMIYLDKTAAIKAGFEGKLIPPGYIMTFPNLLIRKIFEKCEPDVFSGLFKGLIHVYSEIEYYKPMLMKKRYKIKIETSEPIKKIGKKGIYYSITFTISILDKNDCVYVVDNHEFFFKYS